MHQKLILTGSRVGLAPILIRNLQLNIFKRLKIAFDDISEKYSLAEKIIQFIKYIII